MHRLALFIILYVVTCTLAYGGLADIAPVISPDGAYSASLRMVPASVLGREVVDSTLPEAKVAVLRLHAAHSKKVLHAIRIPDADDTDSRNSIELSWSPDGRLLVVQVQVGQLSQYSLYRITSQRLMQLEELPIPEHLVIRSEHQKSRGGSFIQAWRSPDTFTAIDTVADAEYTCRISKKWKIETIASRASQP